jgi:hypothetical protein
VSRGSTRSRVRRARHSRPAPRGRWWGNLAELAPAMPGVQGRACSAPSMFCGVLPIDGWCRERMSIERPVRGQLGGAPKPPPPLSDGSCTTRASAGLRLIVRSSTASSSVPYRMTNAVRHTRTESCIKIREPAGDLRGFDAADMPATEHRLNMQSQEPDRPAGLFAYPYREPRT